MPYFVYSVLCSWVRDIPRTQKERPSTFFAFSFLLQTKYIATTTTLNLVAAVAEHVWRLVSGRGRNRATGDRTDGQVSHDEPRTTEGGLQ